MAAISKGTKIASYVVMEALPGGKGGMSRVYRAVDTRNDMEVALKISRDDHGDPRFNSALKQEVDILKPLRHNGIVRVLPLAMEGSKGELYMARAVELPSNPWYYSMEFLAGGSLSDLIKRLGCIPFSVSCSIAGLLVEAIEYLHRQGVAHLDIKPENVLFRVAPHEGKLIDPVLIDFGVAARTKSPRASGGSLHTMAPEQLKMARGISPPELSLDMSKMDIYSLGVVTYRMWTGKYPYEGLSSDSITNAVLNAHLRPPTELNPSIPARASEFMLEWLNKDPARRPSHADLKRYLQVWSENITHFPHLTKSKERKKWWIFWK
jgi:serine/threonine-protein kinase